MLKSDRLLGLFSIHVDTPQKLMFTLKTFNLVIISQLTSSKPMKGLKCNGIITRIGVAKETWQARKGV